MPSTPTATPRTHAHPAVAVLESMYSAYLAGDRDAIDAVLDDNLTMFDSSHRDLITGFDELNAVRAARGSSPSALNETALTMTDVRVVEHGELLLLLLFGLRVDFREAGAPPDTTITPELSRNSALLRCDSERGWLIVHLHEDVVDAGGQRVQHS